MQDKTRQSDLDRIDSLLKKAYKWGYLTQPLGEFSTIASKLDQKLFKQTINNQLHALHHLLPPIKISKYNLRNRSHNRELPKRSHALLNGNFFTRLLYQNKY